MTLSRRHSLMILPTLVAAALQLFSCAPADSPTEAPGRLDRPRGVVMICIDTLRGDRVGFAGYARKSTPFLDALASESAVFGQAYSTYPKTPPAVASLFTGLHPSAHRVAVRPFRLSPDLQTGAEVFRDAGWQTAAVMTNPHLSPGHGYEQGFDTYYYVSGSEPWSEPDLPPAVAPGPRVELRRAEGPSAYARGDAVNLAALDWLGQIGEEPFFLYLHYMDVHYPYLAPDPWQNRFVSEPGEDRFKEGNAKPLPKGTVSDRDLAYLNALYDGQVAWTDELISRLLVGLEDLGLKDEVMLVITADHGEEFLEHDAFGHGHSVYRELTHVPLLFHGPGVLPVRVAQPVSLIDVMPTIWDWSGLAPIPTQGRSLASALAGHPLETSMAPAVLAEFRGPCHGEAFAKPRVGIATEGWYLVHHFECGEDQLFNWRDDPLLSRDLSGDHPEVVSDLTSWAARTLAESDSQAQGIRIDTTEYDAQTLERLRALGYLR